MQSRKTLPPATGTVRWLGEDPVSGCLWLRITVRGVSQDYEFEEVPGGYNLYRIDPASFSVIRRHIDTTWGHGVWSCDCEDAKQRIERRYQCKHTRAVRVAINALSF